jgi:hypothetical protein
MNRQKHFIHVPLVTSSGAASAKPIGVGLSKLPAPILHGFVGQRHASLCHHLFDMAVAHAEAEIPPHSG